MNTVPKLYKFVNEMRSTTKRSEKIDILKRWRYCTEVMDVIKIVYDPMLTFGMTANSLLQERNTYAEAMPLTDLLRRLCNRELSGLSAVDQCRTYMMIALHNYPSLEGLYDVLLALFDKDLKLGINTKTVNTAIPGAIRTFDVALAFDIDKSASYRRRLESSEYVITRKLDGVRCITIIDNSGIKFYSRHGNEFTSLNVLREAVSTAIPKGWTGVLDGELCVIEDDGIENFKAAVSEIRRKDEQMQRPHYKVFDCLTLPEFYGERASSVYSIRLAKAEQVIGWANSPFLSVLTAVRYTPDSFTKAQRVVAQRGYEGLILRADAPYQSGRTSDLLKVKTFMDGEYQIEDILKTTKMMKGLSGLMEPVECMGAVVIRHKGNPVDVGSGFSDAQRIDIWNNQDKFLGRIITVKYFDEIEDMDGRVHLRFPIFKGFRDEGD